jgi:hypothetical protein
LSIRSSASRADDGKLRATSSAWGDAVVALARECLVLMNIDRQVHVSALSSRRWCSKSQHPAIRARTISRPLAPRFWVRMIFEAPAHEGRPPILVTLVAAITAIKRSGRFGK